MKDCTVITWTQCWSFSVYFHTSWSGRWRNWRRASFIRPWSQKLCRWRRIHTHLQGLGNRQNVPWSLFVISLDLKWRRGHTRRWTCGCSWWGCSTVRVKWDCSCHCLVHLPWLKGTSLPEVPLGHSRDGFREWSQRERLSQISEGEWRGSKIFTVITLLISFP